MLSRTSTTRKYFNKHKYKSLYMSGTPYRWLTVFRKLDVVMSFASYLDQASSRRCCSTVFWFRSSAATLAYISCASLLSLGINLYIPTHFNSFETHCH